MKTQLLLFTENAEVSSVTNGQPGGTLTEKKQIGEAFAGFLNLFDVVYHINGQQTVTLNGDKASGISSCQVVLIGNKNGKKMKTTMGVIYHDVLKKEEDNYKDIAVIRKLDTTMVQRNYLQIKQEIQDITNSEIERLLNDPSMLHLVIKK